MKNGIKILKELPRKWRFSGRVYYMKIIGVKDGWTNGEVWQAVGKKQLRWVGDFSVNETDVVAPDPFLALFREYPHIEQETSDVDLSAGYTFPLGTTPRKDVLDKIQLKR